MISAEKGIIINFELKKYKNYWGLFGWKFGSWESLPEFEKVPVAEYREGSSYHRRGSASILRGGEKHCAFLVYPDSRRKIPASIGDLYKAEEDARYLADRLKVPLDL